MSRIINILASLIIVILCAGLSHGQDLLNGPECIVFDYEHNRYLVSNWVDGTIVAIDEYGTQSYFSTGLFHHSGIHIVGDTLYVARDHHVTGLDLETAEKVMEVYIPGSTLLNCITADTSGFLYVTDAVPANIHRVRISDQTRVVFAHTGLGSPVGLMFDEENNRLLVGDGSRIRAVSLPGAAISTIVNTGLGYIDAITEDTSCNYYITGGAGCTYRFNHQFTNPAQIIKCGYSWPSQLCYYKNDNVLALPDFNTNSIDYISLADTDGDWVIDLNDNCPLDPNTDQADNDEDGRGNVCDGCPDDYNPIPLDTDEDGVEDACDNCPDDYNPNQEDSNGNDIGDVCDYICGDTDNDRVINILDIVYMINYVYKSGPEFDYPESADVNYDEVINILDVVYLINFLYKGGPDPTCP